MTTNRESFVAWLRDAHAMESSTIDNLQHQVDQLEHYPALQTRFRQHREESIRQRARIEDCLGRLGEDKASGVKETVTKLVGNVQAWVTGMSADEVVKQVIGATAFEHFEIANYRSLIAAAEHCAEMGIATTLGESLREEEEMARWLEQQVPEITREFLQRKAVGAPAKS